MRRRLRSALVAPLVGVLLLAGCGYDATELPGKKAAEETPPAGTSSAPECDNATQSYAPSDDAVAARRQLANTGRLVIGVSADSLQLGARDPLEGKIVGFDIDFADRIASELGVRPQLRVISAADRVPLLEKGEIDIVARNMTINCSRWEQIAFSSVYYNATQKVLVRADDAETYTGPESLAKKKVCAPSGTTSVANIKKIEPEVIAVEAANHTGCLVRFQQGDVDAITGDDTVLAGLSKQDPYAVVPVQGKLTDEPYGIGVNKDDVALVRFINSVLQEMRTDGSWKASYDRWLKPELTVDAKPPTPQYGR